MLHHTSGDARDGMRGCGAGATMPSWSDNTRSVVALSAIESDSENVEVGGWSVYEQQRQSDNKQIHKCAIMIAHLVG